MRARRYWPLSIASGVGVAAVSWEFAGLHLGAVGFGFVYAVGLGLLCKAHFDLKSRVDSWKRPSLWSGAFGGLFTFTMLLVGDTAGPHTDPLVVILGLVGVGVLGVAVGTGIALENLDAADAAE
ncbi:hypothetical protein C475_09304 [Halosimplex carlsbadense 2-9-1]|uniref:Uncharacterized protein n=1 Tax=Halosimplex carlsbadense 2-9-1 TaxID=797114 RepID=M0CUT1_9EURY|nr:hypothetical protein [Halosimplex carlsbadense]ELZ25644.1 hypothetical protein C475_09304 [Halosimplex carlsbadense 2-9-1]